MEHRRSDQSGVRALRNVMRLEARRVEQERIEREWQRMAAIAEAEQAKVERRKRAHQRLTRIKRRKNWDALRSRALDRVEQIRIENAKAAVQQAQKTRLEQARKRIRNEQAPARRRHILGWFLAVVAPTSMAAALGLYIAHAAAASDAGVSAGVHNVDAHARIAKLRQGLLAMDAELDELHQDHALLQEIRASAIEEEDPEPKPRPKKRRKKAKPKPKPKPEGDEKPTRPPIVIDWSDTNPLGD